jgi:MoxR-like ATPase
MKIRFLAKKPNEEITLPPQGAFQKTAHVFEEEAILAVNTALAARRPLLVRGEPGTGKSQLARAAAVALDRMFIAKVVDSRTESRDLLWTFDAVARLAEAQLAGAQGHGDAKAAQEARALLDERRFVAPGPLWWAFDSKSATEQAKASRTRVIEPPLGWKQGEGAVLLLDEIDKADSGVPNGLLESLGNGSFAVQGREDVVMQGAPPLVVVTTNEERNLPDAFLRRCMVLHLALPKDKDKLIKWLVQRGVAHFPKCSDSVRILAAELLADDRKKLVDRQLLPPGQAEYLDLLRAVSEIEEKEADQLDLLKRVARFALGKHEPVESS